MTTQDTTPAAIERHMRHAHEIRSEAILHAFGRIPAALGRMARAVTCLFA